MSATTVSAAADATESEVDRYEKAFRETRRVIDESIRALSILLHEEDDSARRDQIALRRLKLKRDRSNLVRANIAFHTGKATMNPPSSTLVSEIIKLAKEAAGFVVERTTAAAVVKLATTALSRFAEIQSIG